MVSSIRGWLRQERSPRLTISALVGLCAALSVTIGYGLARCGVRGWGTRAFWSVLAVWPVFVLLVRWRCAVDFQQMDLGNRDRVNRLIAADELASLDSNRQVSEGERAVYRELGNGLGRAIGSNLLTALLLGSITLGCWLIWDLIRNGPHLLADTIFDAEVVPPRVDLITSVTHRDWRMEALGFTAIYFPGLAFAAACFGHVLPFLVGP
jgi:hypothetical protein